MKRLDRLSDEDLSEGLDEIEEEIATSISALATWGRYLDDLVREAKEFKGEIDDRWVRRTVGKPSSDLDEAVMQSAIDRAFNGLPQDR